jgi:solute carrier family 44 protein 1 (choline transporter-like protein)/choline transporter-like protein 2/4/5
MSDINDPMKSANMGGEAAPTYTSEPGPTNDRRCRDKLFLILFGLFWVGMFVIAGVAIKEGNLNR